MSNRKEMEQAKAARRRRRRRKALLLRAGMVGILLVILLSSILLVRGGIKRRKEKALAAKAKQEQQEKQQQEKQMELKGQMDRAEKAAKGYDYDQALTILDSIKKSDRTDEISGKIKEYQETKATLKEADVETLPHVFFHSLVAEPSITWNLTGEDEYKIPDYNQVMTTIDEFKGILQQMYDKGYVLVRLHDMVEETKDEKGNTVYSKGKIMLPEGKKPFVMSQDDVCYYLYMIGDGFASKMVVGADGRPTTEYQKPDGTTVTGPYDLVPVLNEFIDAHPDFSYRGAKAVLAFTGYNGILGYRTDPDLGKTAAEGNKNAEEFGVFDVAQEIAAVKPVVEALKKDGWELAGHSYGHISYGSDFEKVKIDADKWQERVANIIGPTDILIYPFGTDIGGWGDYTAENEKYSYLKKQGFRFFCNVDSNEYWVQLRPDYLRQGRRNLDGYRMYQDLMKGANKLADLFDVKSVYDNTRPKIGLENWDGA